jgi:hypothetical protein
MGSVIRELMDDEPQRRRIGQAARRTFDESFTRQALLPRYEAIIESALASSPHAMLADGPP